MKYWIPGLLMMMAAACSSEEPEQLRVEGNFLHAAGKRIMLAELPFDRPERKVIDSATLDSTGHFSLNAIQQQEGIYQLFIEGGPGILLINDTNHISVQADANRLNEYQVTKSKASQSIKSLYEKLTELQAKAARYHKSADSIAKIKIPDSVAAPIYAARNHADREISNFLNHYLNMEKNATAAWYGIGVASHFISKDDWAQQVKRAAAMHPNHAGLKLMRVSLAAIEQQEAIGKSLVNKPMPTIYLPDTSGSMVSIRQFKGKWLLVDFWASWCAPCRKENPHLLATYRKFKNQNFDILGVSLDEKKAAWMKAIYTDSLRWTQVSDLKGWESKAVDTFRFNSIPFNVLVDTNGVAVAVNLFGKTLEDSLQGIFSREASPGRK